MTLNSSTAPPCPIWGQIDNELIGKALVHGTLVCNSPRAGGPFVLEQTGVLRLKVLSESRNLTDRQKANLSYWIYEHNLRFRVFDAWPSTDNLIVLNEAWVEGHRNRDPSAEDRMLNFLRESIRDWDAGERREPTSDLKMAAGGCRNDVDLGELENHAAVQGWMGVFTDRGVNTFTRRVNLPARMYVEERTRKLDESRQGFVAMWFDPSMDEAYDHGIKPAICDAGYQALKINDKPFTGGVVDEIMAEIRKSRFVVADFTSSPESGARGGVYLEAGFALGLGKTVFLTCRKDRTDDVHFDIGHLNRLDWETPKDLREQLKNSIEAVLGHGPMERSNEPTGSRQPEHTAK